MITLKSKQSLVSHSKLEEIKSARYEEEHNAIFSKSYAQFRKLQLEIDVSIITTLSITFFCER